MYLQSPKGNMNMLVIDDGFSIPTLQLDGTHFFYNGLRVLVNGMLKKRLTHLCFPLFGKAPLIGKYDKLPQHGWFRDTQVPLKLKNENSLIFTPEKGGSSYITSDFILSAPEKFQDIYPWVFDCSLKTGFIGEDTFYFSIAVDRDDKLLMRAPFNFALHYYFSRKGKVHLVCGKEELNLAPESLIPDSVQIPLAFSGLAEKRIPKPIEIDLENIGHVTMELGGDFSDRSIINCWTDHREYACFEPVACQPGTFGKKGGLWMDRGDVFSFWCKLKLQTA